MQDLFDGLRVKLDARNGGLERGGAKIEQPRRARADEKDAALDLVFADLAVQHLPGGEIPLLGLWRETNPHLAVGFGGDLEISDTDFDDAGLLAEGFLAARAGRFDDVGGRALSKAEHVGGERRVQRVANPHHDGHAADDLVELRNPVERPCALSRILQHLQACRGSRVVGRKEPGIIAGVGKSGLGFGNVSLLGEAMKPITTGALPMALASF